MLEKGSVKLHINIVKLQFLKCIFLVCSTLNVTLAWLKTAKSQIQMYFFHLELCKEKGNKYLYQKVCENWIPSEYSV